MSDHVIIVGVRRAREFVPVSELKQEAGRIGRTHDGRSYAADIILTDDDYEMETLLKGKDSFEAISKLNEVQKFTFYVLPKIISGNVKNKRELKDFYLKTLSSFQGKDVDIDSVIDYFLTNEAMACVGDSFLPLKNGKIAASLYLSVGDVKCLKDNFNKVLIEDCLSDGAIAWALGNLENIRIYGDFGEHREELRRFESDLPREYDCKEGCLITSALWWCMIGNGIPGKQMANNVKQLKRHFGRIFLVLERLGFEKRFLNDLSIRVKRNVSRDLLPFFSDPLMTKARAEGLKWMGYNSAEGTEGIVIEE